MTVDPADQPTLFQLIRDTCGDERLRSLRTITVADAPHLRRRWPIDVTGR